MNLESQGLLEHIRDLEKGGLLVVTGAGISAASGIPTFRGPEPEAIWRENDLRLATYEYFRSDPVGQLAWYLERFHRARQASPNPAHRALVDLEEWVETGGGDFRVVTQNIDTLHEDAGTRHLIKVHGTLDRVRCSSAGCTNAAPRGSLPLPLGEIESFRHNPTKEALPRCPLCDGILRAHVLFFDEHYFEHADYRFHDVELAGSEADLIVFVGTSFSVGVTDLIVQMGRQSRAPMYSIDPFGARIGPPAVVQIPERAEALLPAIVNSLRGQK